MKKLILLAFASGMFFSIYASGRPESIPSKLSEVMTKSWYNEKFKSWNEYLSSNPEDKSGWMEYFRAAIYLELPEEELQRISNEIQTRFENSFETYYTKFKLSGWTRNGVAFLEQALANERLATALPERILLAEIKGTNRSALSSKLFDSKLIYPSLLNYSYNVLMSVTENGILFTQGENTTIPLWLLQDVLNVRKDVEVLNIDLMTNEQYLDRKLKELEVGFVPGDFGSLTRLNPEREFFYALTLPQEDLKMFEDRLYVVGLASQLSDVEISNYDILKKNLESRFIIDYLSVDFNGEPKTATGKSLEVNYIVPFLLLKEFLEEEGRTDEAEKWKEKILDIAERSSIGGRVRMFMEPTEEAPRTFKIVKMDVKRIQKHLTKVKDNIYAYIHETKNSDYRFFLTYLKENGYTDYFNKAKFDLTKYEDAFAEVFLNTYHYQTNPNKNAENFSNYPAMNMSFEAANIYCEWLTAQYNAHSGRKFKKVRFRLPTRKEWTMAALGYPHFQSWNFEDNVVKARPYGQDKPKYFEEFRIGDFDSVSYPWYHYHWYEFRNSIKNEKGCFLANIKTTEKSCPNGMLGDGFAITSPVASYFSSDMGLYDVIGNVAEMIDEEGKAMGGSWNHPANQSTITSINEYEGADPTVGFRIFMEVIEE